MMMVAVVQWKGDDRVLSVCSSRCQGMLQRQHCLNSSAGFFSFFFYQCLKAGHLMQIKSCRSMKAVQEVRKLLFCCCYY